MNKLTIYTLKALRKAYAKLFNVQPLPKPACEQDPDLASKLIYDMLMDDKPCMIARFGANELASLVNYVGVKNNQHDYFGYIKGKALPWWWNMNHIEGNMYNLAGFFPPTQNNIEQFCELMLEDMKELDVLGSWLANEKYFENSYTNSQKVWLDFLTPFFAQNPWSMALKGKKVLVVHPFTYTIKNQFKIKDLLFEDKRILPDFELFTIQAVQSIGGENNGFNDWFEALDFMKNEIDKVDYEICLIGAGAYGFPLAAHVKRRGKKAVHMGGALQLLFGIIGKRWEDPNLNKEYSFAELINENWVRPSVEEKPKTAEIVEGACYW